METVKLLIAILVSGGIWFYILYQKDRIEPEPLRVILRVGILGGLLSVLCAGTFNSLFSHATGIAMNPPLPLSDALIASAFIGINEEFFKAMATLLLVRKLADFNEPVDGMIYGMTVALGFAVLENVEYTLIGTFADGIETLVLRSFLTVPGHLGFAALWGYGLSVARFRYPGRGYAAVMGPYILVSAAFHALYDFIIFRFNESPLSLLIVLIVAGLYLFSSWRINRLVEQSNFLKPGECPRCRKINAARDSFCGRCGMRLDSPGEFFKVCPSCSGRMLMTDIFCPSCGKLFQPRSDV